MGRQEKIGWAIAAVCAVGWWLSPTKLPITPSSSSVTMPSEAQAPSSVSIQPSNTSIAYRKPDISRPKVQWLYTTANVRVRAAPNTSAPVLETLALGELIQTNSLENGWYNVTVSARNGWIHENYLATDKPVSLTSGTPASRPNSVRSVEPGSMKGQPVRDPYVGKCDCPYDLMADGSICGERSTYTRSGESPGCYWE